MVLPEYLRSLGRRGALGGAASLLAAPAIVRAQGANGVALVIGNSRYKWEASLPNVKRDAADVARSFQAMGLRTELLEDAGQSGMLEAIDKFKTAARGARFAAFYFAGHGAQWERFTYLVPVDADLSVPKVDGLINTRVANTACSVARANMRIYDNCRDNPADGWRQRQAEDQSFVTGLARASFVKGNPNSLAIFSTVPGRAALDGPAGQNSPFAAGLLQLLDSDPVDVASLAQRLRREVAISTRGRQVVVDFSSYSQPFSLKGAGLGRPAPRGVEGADIIELTKAYTFARDHKILLPQGLVAIRSSTNAMHQQKVGSFKYTETTSKSGSNELILTVLSVNAEGVAQIVLAGPSYEGWWKFIRGNIVSERLEFRVADVPSSPHLSFRWRDANSGRMTMMWPGTSNASPVSSTFERLDG